MKESIEHPVTALAGSALLSEHENRFRSMTDSMLHLTQSTTIMVSFPAPKSQDKVGA